MTQEEKTYLKKLREAGYSRQEIICSLVSDILGKSCSIKETEDYLRTLQQRGMDGEQILSYLVSQKLQKEIPSNETEGLLAPVPAMNKLALVSLCGGIYTGRYGGRSPGSFPCIQIFSCPVYQRFAV